MKEFLAVVGLLILSSGPLFADAPSMPANFSVASPVLGTAEVTWNNVADETSFEIGWGPSNTGTNLSLAPDTTSHSFTGLGTGISYDFRIQACNGMGCSDWTDVVGQTPNASNGLPGLVNNIVAASTILGSVVVTWDDVNNETSTNETFYELGWGPSAITDTITLPANTWNHFFDSLGSGISYLFQIRACNSLGCGPSTVIIGQTPDGATECLLSQNLWFGSGKTTLSYLLAASYCQKWCLGD